MKETNKTLTGAGIGSRRVCVKLIQEGMVTVNREDTKLGDKVLPDLDKICLNSRLISPPATHLKSSLHKHPALTPPLSTWYNTSGILHTPGGNAVLRE